MVLHQMAVGVHFCLARRRAHHHQVEPGAAQQRADRTEHGEEKQVEAAGLGRHTIPTVPLRPLRRRRATGWPIAGTRGLLFDPRSRVAADTSGYPARARETVVTDSPRYAPGRGCDIPRRFAPKRFGFPRRLAMRRFTSIGESQPLGTDYQPGQRDQRPWGTWEILALGRATR